MVVGEKLAHLNYVRSKCVTQRSDKSYYFPKTIPKERSNIVALLTSGIILFLLLYKIWFRPSEIFRIFCLLIYLVVIVVFYRLLMLFEEYQHLHSRYENIQKLLKIVFSFSNSFLLLLISSLFVLFGFGKLHLLFEPSVSLEDIFIVYLIGKIVNLESDILKDSLWMSQNNGLHCGAGMAYSFYYGYLKIILEETGNEQKHFQELIKDYQSKHQVTFDVHKLFIIIPKSMKCFVSLANEYSPSVVEPSSSLPEIIKTVAGVQNRVYKNAVYKIKKPNSTERLFICAEYATPLKTFSEVMLHSKIHSATYRELKNDIVLQFYLTLKYILQEDSLDHICELIFFDDINENGEYHDIGHVLYSRIYELKKRQEKKEL